MILKLAQAEIPLLLVTGRSTGWVDALRYYLPVAGAIAKNGGVYLAKTGNFELLSSLTNTTAHREKLADAFYQIKQQFPKLQESADIALQIHIKTYNRKRRLLNNTYACPL